jgi:hypothetical protein
VVAAAEHREPEARAERTAEKRRVRWRAALIAIHRDLGFLAIGLTLVYAISGIAVNHRHDWDYNRSTSVETTRIGTPADLLSDLPEARLVALAQDPTTVSDPEVTVLSQRIGEALGKKAPPKNLFWRAPDRLSLHFETGGRDAVEYALRTGEAEHTVSRERFLLRDLNFLHLNEGRGAWTWVADIFAGALLFLALSGAIMVKGRKGLRGRGGILLAIGVALPIVAALILRG